MTEEQDFKVIDRRGSQAEEKTPAKESAPTSEKEREKQKGEGFVMSESSSDAPADPTEIDFSTFIYSLATGALIHMGYGVDPSTKKVQKNLELARQNIDLLALLKEKTKGNLTGDETNLMENLLADVRLRFVEASKN